jgi:hypothetical protein
MLKTGNEPLTVNGQKLDKSLLDFWRWNSSDLLSNATRGRLAEFIVASASGVANKRVTIAIRSADIYFFCVLHQHRKETCDPLNLDHWEFYVVNTEELNSRAGNQCTINLNSLPRITSSVTYLLLKEQIEKSFKRNDSEQIRGFHWSKCIHIQKLTLYKNINENH